MPKPLTRPLKVGFDLDGVLLYNPARLARPVIKIVKHHLLGQKKVTFFVPKSSFQRLVWDLMHESSLFIAPGINDIKSMVNQNQIEAYIITGRFKHLLNNTQKWINRLDKDGHFKQWFYNQRAHQPHTYKEKLIKDLALDVFIDDNYDIVQYLHAKIGEKTRIYWIYNLLDKHLPHPYKFGDLQQAVNHLKQRV